LKTCNQINLLNKDVILRVDFNVPLVHGVIQNDYRLVESLPTIKYLLDQGAKVRIISHLGRPTPADHDKLSLKILLEPLKKLLQEEVVFMQELIPTNAKIALYENIRFFPGEEENSPELSQKIAKIGTVFILDAFGCAHRAHASVVGVMQYVETVAIGFLIAKEIKYLEQILQQTSHNSLAVIGGAKISTKINVLKRLAAKFSYIIVAGKMANTLLHVQGINIGASVIEEDMQEIAREILNSNAKIILPIDGIDQYGKVKKFKDFLINDVICDVGLESLKLFDKYIKMAQLILWNGPLGIFEQAEFANGTATFAKLVANAKQAITVIGGGETVSAIEQFSNKELFTHVSTGGGAFLEYLENGSLVALEAVKNHA
jgi:3-phosphoglycerate kinase